jgi:hypothetical protein
VRRFTIFAGATALMVVLPAVTLGAPTGGAVYRPAPVIARPALPQRTAEQTRSNFTVPFHIDAAPKAAPETLRLPTPQWYTRHAWTWQPTYLLANPCFANGANWAPLQNFAAAQSMPEFTIGSLAGNPSHSVLSKTASDIASLASSSTAAADSARTTGLQFEWQPSICGPQGMF